MPRPGPAAASPAAPAAASPAAAGALSPAERRGRLAQALDAALAESPPGPPIVLFLRDVPGGAGPDAPPGGAELGWLDLGGRDPVEALLGFTAPPDWHAMGLACSGRAAPVPGAGAGLARPDPVRVVVLLDRDGHATTVLRRGPDAADVLDEAPEGLVGDCLRRALGVATAPPPASSARFWVAVWLDRVVAALVDDDHGGGPPHRPQPAPGQARSRAVRAWPAVAALHPAFPPHAPRRPPAEPAALAAATHRLAGAWPWGRLRAEGPPVAAGTVAPDPAGAGLAALPAVPAVPPPDVAAWMDDGMYARWCTGAVPDLLDTCHHLLAPEAWACLAATVAATGSPGETGGPAGAAGCAR